MNVTAMNVARASHTGDLVDDVALALAREFGGTREEFLRVMADVAAHGPHCSEHPLSDTLDAAAFTERNWVLLSAALTAEVQELGKASIAELVQGVASRFGGAGGLSTLEVEAALIDRRNVNWPVVANAIGWWALHGVAQGIENETVSMPAVCDEMGWPAPEMEYGVELGGDDTRGRSR